MTHHDLALTENALIFCHNILLTKKQVINLARQKRILVSGDCLYAELQGRERPEEIRKTTYLLLTNFSGSTKIDYINDNFIVYLDSDKVAALQNIDSGGAEFCAFINTILTDTVPIIHQFVIKQKLIHD